MSVEPIGMVFIVLGLLVVLYGPTFGIYVLVCATLLAAAGAMLLSFGGTIQPAYLLLWFVAPGVLSSRYARRAIATTAAFPKEGFWLSAFTIYAVFSAFVFPRMFAGRTEISPVGRSAYGDIYQLVPLGPTSGNYTQSIYLIATMTCFFTVLSFCRSPGGNRTVAKALVAMSFLNVFFACMDLLTFWTQTDFLLSPIRNAQYAFHTDETVDGVKRIVGSFTEASAFSNATAPSVAFTASLFLSGIWPRTTGAITLLSMIFLVLSTSSTGLAVLLLILGYLYISTLFEIANGVATAQTRATAIFGPVAIGIVLVGIALVPGWVDGLLAYLNQTLFEKASSESGLTRAVWNATAIRTFYETWGFGGGLGSLRASSFVLAILSNVGLIGGILYLLFLRSVFFSPRLSLNIGSNSVTVAARAACVASLATAVVSGTNVDIGLQFYIYAALACSSPERAIERNLVRARSNRNDPVHP